MRALRFYVGADNATGARIPSAVVADVLSREGIHAFTLSRASGFWNGKPERTSIVDVVGGLLDDETADRIAATLAVRWAQDSVLWTAADVRSALAGSGAR